MRELDITSQLADLEPGNMTTIELEDEHQILVTNIDGTFHAIYGKCSHYGAPLQKGALDRERVICPWHHACFSVRTGEQLEGPGMDSLPAYTIVERGEQRVLQLPDTLETTCPAHLTQREENFDETYVIVGGGPAGTYAAEGMRRARFRGNIVLLSGETELPYDRTKASKAYLTGNADDAGMPLQPRSFYDTNDIDLRLGVRATQLDRSARTVTLDNGATLRYDKLLIASGSTANRLPVAGADLDGVFTLRTWNDARALRERAKSVQHVVVVGASFIGMEAAQALQKHGPQVTVVAPEKIPFAGVFGAEVGTHITRLHRDAGIAFKLEARVAKLHGTDGTVTAVELDNGERLPAELVVTGIGVKPSTDWLPDGLTTERGTLEVDDRMRIDDTLYAAGDVARFPWHGQHVHIEHWKVAADQGRAAGRAMAGDTGATYTAVPYFWTAQQGKNFRYTGHAGDWDRIEIDGSVADNDFIARYYQNGEVRAILGVGRDQEVARLQASLLED